MKILQVRFRNLNSLAGEWVIDFTRPEYTADGIFAITGPTGSGKTTLLDAICLALYGRTPRLDRVSESTNEIMSRHTGLCLAEIDFQTRKGHFRCHWSQRRAREKATGKLQQPRHEIIDGQTNKILESKIKKVARKVEEVCGMDFDQFTRSVLLAQGGFAAFLEAKGDERAPILEQITGTEIYSRISLKVHQRRNEELQKLQQLESGIGANSLLTQDEVATLQQELDRNTLLAKQAAEKLENSQTALNWLTRLNTLREDIAALEAEALQIKKHLQESEPDKIRLDRAQKANALSSASLHLGELLKLQDKEKREREKTVQEIRLLELRHGERQKALVDSESSVKNARAAMQAEGVLCRQVRELDVKLTEENGRQEKLQELQKSTAAQLIIHEKNLNTGKAAITAKDKQLAEAKDYLLQHEKDASLMEDMAGLLEFGKHISLLSTKAHSLQNELKKAQGFLQQASQQTLKIRELYSNNLQRHETARARLAVPQKELEDLLQGRKPADLRDIQSTCLERLHTLERMSGLSKQMTASRKEIDDILLRVKEATSEVEGADRSRREIAETIAIQQKLVEKQRQLVFLSRRIHDYEEERKRLADDVPCPLCGSLVHPFKGYDPVISNASELELQQLESTLRSLQNDDAELKAKIAAATERIQQSEESRKKVQTRLDEDNKEYAELTSCINCPPDAVETEIARLDHIRKQGERRLHRLDEKIQELETARENEEKQRDIVNAGLQSKQQAEHAENSASESCKRLQKQADQAEHDLLQNLDELRLRLTPYEIASVVCDSLPETLAELNRRRQSWKRQKECEQQITTELQALYIVRERAESLVEKSKNELETADVQLRLGQDHLDALMAERRNLYQDKNPDTEEQKAAENVTKAETGLTTLAGEMHRLEKDLAALDERNDLLRRSLTEREVKLKQLKEDFFRSLIDKGFTDEADFQSALLSETDMEKLTASFDRLAKQEAEIATRLAGKRQSLTLESRKQLTDTGMDELKSLIREKTQSLQDLQQEVGRLKGKLQDFREQIQRQQNRLEARQKQQQEYIRWQILHDLIGSSDGKKFRNFAQGVTFEIMIDHANRSLRKMSDRYILIRDNLQPLELNVVDTYQAGDTRSTKNLSGGESFIVSMALALGLAAMAGSKVRVDSLFLDEGFGTLDEDSLETALETLAGLHQEGKIIGIISHVAVLQERIATRIQVIPGPAGASRLLGPGVTKI